MLDFNEIIEDIRDNGGFYSNSKEDSFYRVYKTQGFKPIQVRISNHGTHLWTWIDRNYDPSRAINICIVFSKDGNYDTDTKVDMDLKYKNENGESKIVGQRNSFEVVQYVYNCQLLEVTDARQINSAIQTIYKNKGFQDPLINTTKQAIVCKLTPNQEPICNANNTQNNNRKNIKEIENKQIIKLSEARLRRIINESITKVLSEISINLADRAAGAAYKKAREGFGMYEPYNEIPHDSYHGKKIAQGEKFLTYRNNKLNRGDESIGIAYVGDQLVLRNYKTGKVLTKPCDSIEE